MRVPSTGCATVTVSFARICRPEELYRFSNPRIIEFSRLVPRPLEAISPPEDAHIHSASLCMRRTAETWTSVSSRSGYRAGCAPFGHPASKKLQAAAIKFVRCRLHRRFRRRRASNARRVSDSCSSSTSENGRGIGKTAEDAALVLAREPCAAISFRLR